MQNILVSHLFSRQPEYVIARFFARGATSLLHLVKFTLSPARMRYDTLRAIGINEGRSYGALVCLRDRSSEGVQPPGSYITGRLRNDFWNRLSRQSEEKFGNFLGLICWSVSIEMLREIGRAHV